MGRKCVWTPAQSKQFLTFHADHRMRAAWALAIVVGARRGEIAGLKWSRIDLDRGVLYLHWQRTTTSTGVVEKTPKGKSKRTVAIGPALVAELRAHRNRQSAEKEHCRSRGSVRSAAIRSPRSRRQCCTAASP